MSSQALPTAHLTTGPSHHSPRPLQSTGLTGDLADSYVAARVQRQIFRTCCVEREATCVWTAARPRRSACTGAARAVWLRRRKSDIELGYSIGGGEMGHHPPDTGAKTSKDEAGRWSTSPAQASELGSTPTSFFRTNGGIYTLALVLGMFVL